LSDAAPAVGTTQERSQRLTTKVAEAITRFGLPVFLLCLPLEFTSTLLRLQLARIVLLVVGVAFAYLVVTRERRLTIPVAASSVLVVVYASAAVLSWLSTRAPGSLNALADITLYPLTALLIFNLTRTEQDHRNAWLAFLVSGVAIAFLVAFLYYTHLWIWRPDPGGLRVNATFADPNIAARFLTIAAVAAISLYAARVSPDRLAIAVAAACAAFVTFTFSKTSLGAFPASVIVATGLARKWRRAAYIGGLTFLVFAVAVIIVPGAAARVERVLGIVSAPVAAPEEGATLPVDSVRTYLIVAGWQMFLDHPLTGVGFGGYQHAIKTTYSRFLPVDAPATLSHTSAITILSEQGVIGGVLFAAFLLLLALELWPSIRRPTHWRVWIVTPALVLIPILGYSQLEGRLIEEPYLWVALGLLYSAMALEGSTRTVQVRQ
jgi:O-antigen ligase